MSGQKSHQSGQNKSKFDPYDHLKVVLNPDGSLTRLIQLPTTPVTGEETADMNGQAVVSKEFVLDAEKETNIRLYRPTKIPSNDTSVERLPIMFYYHGGGWINFNIQCTMVHETCNLLAIEVPALVISVGYCHAPEYKLPSQYDDAMDAIKWLQTQATDPNGDSWIRDYGDISRCYLYGVSCGGNIAFHAAMRIIDTKFEPVCIAGIILNQPLFGGISRTRSELKLAADIFFPLPVIDLLWEFALPHGTDRDHRFCNPLIDEPSKEKIKHLTRTLVIGFGGDPLIDRQQAFVEMLVMQGIQVEARFDDVGFHCIDMIDSRRAAAILTFIKDFVC